MKPCTVSLGNIKLRTEKLIDQAFMIGTMELIDMIYEVLFYKKMAESHKCERLYYKSVLQLARKIEECIGIKSQRLL